MLCSFSARKMGSKMATAGGSHPWLKIDNCPTTHDKAHVGTATGRKVRRRGHPVGDRPAEGLPRPRGATWPKGDVDGRRDLRPVTQVRIQDTELASALGVCYRQ